MKTSRFDQKPNPAVLRFFGFEATPYPAAVSAHEEELAHSHTQLVVLRCSGWCLAVKLFGLTMAILSLWPLCLWALLVFVVVVVEFPLAHSPGISPAELAFLLGGNFGWLALGTLVWRQFRPARRAAGWIWAGVFIGTVCVLTVTNGGGRLWMLVYPPILAGFALLISSWMTVPTPQATGGAFGGQYS